MDINFFIDNYLGLNAAKTRWQTDIQHISASYLPSGGDRALGRLKKPDNMHYPILNTGQRWPP